MANQEFDVETHGELLSSDTDAVRIRMARLINLGDFNNLTIDITVVSSKKDGENMGETFDRVFGFVESRLLEKAELVEG